MTRTSDRRVLAVALAAVLVPLAAAAAAPAAEVPLKARSQARVQALVPTALRGQRLRVTIDGRPRTVLTRPADLLGPGLSTAPVGGWHHLAIRGPGSTARARFAIGRSTGQRAPTIVLTQAPAAQSGPGRAAFRYDASGGTVTCTLDGTAQPCSSRSLVVTVSPGPHVVVVRARGTRGSAVLQRRWTTAGEAPVTTTESSSDPPAPAGWTLLMADDFDGSNLDPDRWFAYGPRWAGNGGNGIRDGSAVSVAGGVLTITAKMVDGTLVSGAVGSRINRTYGRVEFRARTDPDPSGTTSGVVLMWPQSDDWPTDGEIDIYETGTATRSWFSSFVHYGADNRQLWFGHDADATEWHEIAMEWTPDAIRFYRDGNLEGTTTNPEAIPRVPLHLTIQLDPFDPTMTGRVTMQVDDVRIYAPS